MVQRMALVETQFIPQSLLEFGGEHRSRLLFFGVQGKEVGLMTARDDEGVPGGLSDRRQGTRQPGHYWPSRPPARSIDKMGNSVISMTRGYDL
jgi:hypothetical protein